MSRVETLYPEVDWIRLWGYFNTMGLEAEKRTFVFRLLHNILPVNIRLFRMNLAVSPACELCSHGAIEDMTHAVLECSFNSFINDWIVALLYDIDTNLLDSHVTSLNISTLNIPISHDRRFPVLCFITTSLMLVWKSRCDKRQLMVTILQSDLDPIELVCKATFL